MPPSGKRLESAASLVVEPQGGGDALCRVVMDDRPESALEVAHRARADAGSLCQPFLGQARRIPQALESGAKVLIDVIQIGDLNGE